jgi:hypothetical protein
MRPRDLARSLARELAGPAFILAAALAILAPQTLGGRSIMFRRLGDPVFRVLKDAA